MRLQNTLKNFRLSKRFTQKDLARLLGITRNYVYMVETGRAWPSAKLLKRYAETFHFNYEWIINLLAESKVSAYRRQVYARLRRQG